MTARELLEEAARLAADAASDASGWDARILLAGSMGRRNPLSVDPGAEVPAGGESRFRDAWALRIRGVPVQHILGEWDFFGRPFRVDRRALVPRPETETLVAAALARQPDARRILDAGTGGGILAISLLLELAGARAVGLDVSPEALALAGQNAARHGVRDRLALVASDWLSAVGRARFDLAVANPPYLAESDAVSLSPTVRDHEPARALYAGSDGMIAIRSLLDSLPRVLEPGAPLLCEIGFGQAPAVEAEIRRRDDWKFEGILPDSAAIPRVAVAVRRRSD